MEFHFLKLLPNGAELRRSDDGAVIAVWDRALTAEEVAEIANDEFMLSMLVPIEGEQVE